jgi:glycosyltransferase involved in cell wall biosynthesis
MRVAFVHDNLVQRGGSERVLLSMLAAFPGAPVFTAFYRPEATYAALKNHDVRPMAMNRLAALRRHHRAAFPALPFLFSRLDVDADVVVCSSSGWAQAVRTSGRKVVYFHALAQWLHSPVHHIAGDSAARRVALGVARSSLTGWDRRTVLSADRHLVMGRAMHERVAGIYGVDADVLPPPISLERDGRTRPIRGLPRGFFLAVARLMPYKNLDAVVGAFAQMPDEQLVIAGAGPDGRRLQSTAPDNVRFVGLALDPELRWLYANCRALVSSGFEAYPLTPIEAAGFAKPTLALREGGSVEVVVEGKTGEFFDRADATTIAAAVRRLDGRTYDTAEFERLREAHRESTFVARLRAIVDQQLDWARRPSPS